MTKRFLVTVDFDANAAYVSMSDEEVTSTKHASEDVLVDLDAFNVVAGVEFLRLDAEIPFQTLVDDFHVHSEDVELLRALRPSIGARLHSAADGMTQVPQMEPARA